jgi:hypothetical protein
MIEATPLLATGKTARRPYRLSPGHERDSRVWLARSNYCATEAWGSASTRSTRHRVCAASAQTRLPTSLDAPMPPAVLVI